jgi:hypothetical protein
MQKQQLVQQATALAALYNSAHMQQQLSCISFYKQLNATQRFVTLQQQQQLMQTALAFTTCFNTKHSIHSAIATAQQLAQRAAKSSNFCTAAAARLLAKAKTAA